METGRKAKKKSMRLFTKSQSPYGTVLLACVVLGKLSTETPVWYVVVAVTVQSSVSTVVMRVPVQCHDEGICKSIFFRD